MYNYQTKSISNNQTYNEKTVTTENFSNCSMQQSLANPAVFQSNSFANKMLNDKKVIQRKEIDATLGHYTWYSNAGFDAKHLGVAPTTEQGWIDWRNLRWPGISPHLPGCTLITGDLNLALNGNHYENYEEYGNQFKVTVTCNACTVLTYNAHNALTIPNLRLVHDNKVRLGGYINESASGNTYYRFTHLFYGL